MRARVRGGGRVAVAMRFESVNVPLWEILKNSMLDLGVMAVAGKGAGLAKVEYCIPICLRAQTRNASRPIAVKADKASQQEDRVNILLLQGDT